MKPATVFGIARKLGSPGQICSAAGHLGAYALDD
jgi:hypothetical protein